MKYHIKDKTHYKLIYLHGCIKHFARITEYSQVIRLKSTYDSNYYPFDNDIFYGIKYSIAVKPSHIEALLEYMHSKEKKQYVSCDLTKMDTYKKGTLKFYLNDKLGKVLLADCSFTKTNIDIVKNQIKFEDGYLENEFYLFLVNLEQLWNQLPSVGLFYNTYSMRAFRKYCLAKVKND